MAEQSRGNFHLDMSTEELMEWLRERGLGEKDLKVVKEQEIDGEAFLELTKEEVQSLVPNKLGVVKKICRLVKQSNTRERTGKQIVRVSNLPFCASGPTVSRDDTDGVAAPLKAASANVACSKLWDNRKVLKVYFTEEDSELNWKHYGDPINIANILDWANIWTHPALGGDIPVFQRKERKQGSDIRVKLTPHKEGCWSMVGTDAIGKDETMVLNLGESGEGYPREALQKSLVIHEFGHALGLEHEHQRSDFWDVLGEYIDDEKMKEDPLVKNIKPQEDGKSGFGSQWYRKEIKGECSKYDSSSVMHYMFKAEWLKEGVRTYSEIQSNPGLTVPQKEYLEGILERSGWSDSLPRVPSILDFETLKKAYADQLKTDSPQPDPKLSSQEELGAHCNKIWKGRGAIKVWFMNPDYIEDWKCKGEPLSISTVQAWAEKWKSPLTKSIPTLEWTELARRADIRVQFSDTGRSWTMVGSDANLIQDLSKPTMVLNISKLLQKESVLHQFGHALGLEHEHQRSDFWDVVEPFIDIEYMKESVGGKRQFNVDWHIHNDAQTVNILSEYDPKSIMHYRFDVQWLKDKRLQKEENIDSYPGLSPTAKQYLKGLHEASKDPEKTLSENDVKRLEKAYARTGKNSDSATNDRQALMPIDLTPPSIMIDVIPSIARKKIWKEREALKVYFMNPDELDGWKSHGEPMNMSTVLAWARVWNVPFFSDTIPYLSWTEVAEKADIRVKFSGMGGNWSMVGTDAETVTDKSKPTMMLNLLGHPAILQESLVIHQFGHALGLEHEHQRSDFWDVVEKHIDMDAMKDDTWQSFEKDWYRVRTKKGELGVNTLSDYDPNSIMHYWFKDSWIKDEHLRSYEDIESNLNLSDKEKRFLKGIVQRSQVGQLPKQPSVNDYERLAKVYGNSNSIASPKALSLLPTSVNNDGTRFPLKIWKGRKALKVYFMNLDELDDWKSRGEPMNMSTVLAWARVWNVPFFGDTIPYLSWTENAKNADIRVKLCATGGNWSMIGTDAETVTDNSKPTMRLSLRGHSAILQESMVIHEFGRALGLEHEHQRSDFWDVVEKHIDMDAMKGDTFVNPRRESDGGQSFGKDWYKVTTNAFGVNTLSDYDPNSIMHYWFKVSWIQDEHLRSNEDIDSDRSLSDKEKRFLKGIVQRSQGGPLLKQPSVNDFQRLAKAYGYVASK